MTFNYRLKKMILLCFFVILLLCLGCLFACADTNEEKTGNEIFAGLHLVPNRSNLPQLSDFDAIKLGQTTVMQLEQLLGSPQSSNTSGLPSCMYRTSDGYAVQLFFVQHMEQDIGQERAEIRVGEFYVHDMVVFKVEMNQDGSEKLVEVETSESPS